MNIRTIIGPKWDSKTQDVQRPTSPHTCASINKSERERERKKKEEKRKKKERWKTQVRFIRGSVASRD